MNQTSTLSQTNVNDSVGLTIEGEVAYITLQNGERHNTLTFPLLEQLNERLKQTEETKELKALVLEAEGRSFSTGGDLRGFSENLHQIETYAHGLVGLLNEAMMRMFRLPIPIIAKIHGPVTGGSFGLVLASDLIVMADTAFFAPYYVDVGFSPDGGWAAILPEIIGEKAAKSIQLLNQQISAEQALELGIVDKITTKENLHNVISQWTTAIQSKVALSVRQTKYAILTEEKLTRYEMALEKERRDFITLIKTQDAQTGMKNFLKQFS